MLHGAAERRGIKSGWQALGPATLLSRKCRRAFIKTRSPGDRPGLRTQRNERKGRLRDLLERLGDAALDRLGGLGGELLRRGGQFLGVLGGRLGLPGGVRGG